MDMKEEWSDGYREIFNGYISWWYDLLVGAFA